MRSCLQSTSLKPEQQQHNLVPNDCVPFTMCSLAGSDFTSVLVIVSILGFTVSSFHRSSEMAYWLKLPVATSNDLNSISWIHVVEENQFFKVVLWPLLVHGGMHPTPSVSRVIQETSTSPSPVPVWSGGTPAGDGDNESGWSEYVKIILMVWRNLNINTTQIGRVISHSLNFTFLLRWGIYVVDVCIDFCSEERL